MNMGKLMSVVEDALKYGEWNYRKIERTCMFSMDIECENGTYKIFIEILEEREVIVVYVSGQNLIDEEYRINIMEFFAQINYAIKIGHFEIDMNDGEIRVKNSIRIRGGKLSRDMVEELLSDAYLLMDFWFPGITAICYDNLSIDDAIEIVNNRRSS